MNYKRCASCGSYYATLEHGSPRQQVKALRGKDIQQVIFDDPTDFNSVPWSEASDE